MSVVMKQVQVHFVEWGWAKTQATEAQVLEALETGSQVKTADGVRLSTKEQVRDYFLDLGVQSE